MREIGSEFWDVPVQDTGSGLFPPSVQWYLSGRSALYAIIRELDKSKTVYMPSWCCDSMIRPFADAGMKICFYSAFPQEDRPAPDDGILFVMDYFGYTGKAVDRKDFRGTVIRDLTHSLFSGITSDADYYFGSLRKWCGVWTGGYAWTRDGNRLADGAPGGEEYILLRREAMRKKEQYIHRAAETASDPQADKSYLQVFDEAEQLLEKYGIEAADPRDIRMAAVIDADFIRKRRRANAEVLRKAFPELLIFPDMREEDCPMFVPIRVTDGKRDPLRRYLIENGIYCPVHWPLSPYHRPDGKTLDLYRNGLSLVCDQRYTEEDMERIAEAVGRFMKGIE